MVEIYCSLIEENDYTFYCFKNNRGDAVFGSLNQPLSRSFVRVLYAFLSIRGPENISIFMDESNEYQFNLLREYISENQFFIKNTTDFFWLRMNRDFIHTQINAEISDREEVKNVKGYAEKLRDKRFKS